MKKILLFTCFLFSVANNYAQQLFVAQPLIPGYSFDVNAKRFKYPILSRVTDLNSYTFSIDINKLQILKIRSKDTLRFPIPVFDMTYLNTIAKTPDEIIITPVAPPIFYSDGLKVTSLDSTAAFIYTYNIEIRNIKTSQNRILYLNMIGYFDGTKLTCYKEKETGQDYPYNTWMGIAQTKKYLWFNSIVGLTKFDKAKRTFTIYNSYNSPMKPINDYQGINLFSDDSTFAFYRNKSQIFEFKDGVDLLVEKFPGDSVINWSFRQNYYFFLGRDSLYISNKGIKKSYKLPYTKSLGVSCGFRQINTNLIMFIYSNGFITFNNGIMTPSFLTDFDSKYILNSYYGSFDCVLQKDSATAITIFPYSASTSKLIYHFKFKHNAITFIGKHGNPNGRYYFEKNSNNDNYLYFIKFPQFVTVKNNIDTTFTSTPSTYTSYMTDYINTYIESDNNYVWIGTAQALENPIINLWRAPKVNLVTGINNIYTKQQGVYPNPSSSEINFEGSFDKPWIITNSVGQEVLKGLGHSANIESVPSGVYFIHANGKVSMIIKN
jgi:hypothetical protein